MLVPIFELFYEKKNITKDVSKYVTSIEYTDAEHGESDELQISFEDSDKLWQSSWIPTKGDSLRAYIGYEAEKLLNCGVFEIDELEYDTPPDVVTVKGLATGIKKPLRQKNSVAYEDKTLKQIANEIANKHGLTLVGEIENIKVENKKVVVDGKMITATGAGAANEFAIELIRALCGDDKANEIGKSVRFL